MHTGKLIVISGPSGVGKGTIVRNILSMDDNISVSISSTTRKIRPGEINGKDYFFITKEEFESDIKNNQFAEYAIYAGNYYGTLCKTIDRDLNMGKNLILEIDVQGAFQIRKKYPDAKLVFILPPNLLELKKRLLARNTESTEEITKRLSQVDREINLADEFDVKIVNDNLELATMSVLEVIYS